MDKIQQVKRNESAWNYLRGVLDHCEDGDTAETQRKFVMRKCLELIQEGCDSSYLHGFVVELYKHQLEDDPEADKEEIVKKINDLCHKLSQELDIVRSKYWTFISDSISRKYTNTVA